MVVVGVGLRDVRRRARDGMFDDIVGPWVVGYWLWFLEEGGTFAEAWSFGRWIGLSVSGSLKFTVSQQARVAVIKATTYSFERTGISFSWTSLGHSDDLSESTTSTMRSCPIRAECHASGSSPILLRILPMESS